MPIWLEVIAGVGVSLLVLVAMVCLCQAITKRRQTLTRSPLLSEAHPPGHNPPDDSAPAQPPQLEPAAPAAPLCGAEDWFPTPPEDSAAALYPVVSPLEISCEIAAAGAAEPSRALPPWDVMYVD